MSEVRNFGMWRSSAVRVILRESLVLALFLASAFAEASVVGFVFVLGVLATGSGLSGTLSTLGEPGTLGG